jgi:hypothetical protein
MYVIERGPANRSLTHESTALKGYAYVEFASTEEALRATCQGAPHGFRYRQWLLDIDFSPSVFYVGSAYNAVYISGWPAANGRPALLQWIDDIPNIAQASICTSLFRFTQNIHPQPDIMPYDE